MGQQWNKIYKDKLTKYNYYDLTKPNESLAKFVRILYENKYRTVLELDSGAGRNLIVLREEGFVVSGIDQSEAGINITTEILESKNLIANLSIGDIFKKLPYANQSFEAVMSSHLNHATEEEIINAINEVKRILIPNGLLFITLPFRKAHGKVRPVIVQTAKKIAPNTFIPTIGDEIGLPHFIYNETLVKKHYKDFQILEKWRDSRDYFCFIARLK